MDKIENPVLKKLIQIVAFECGTTPGKMISKDLEQNKGRWLFYYISKNVFDIPYLVSTAALGNRTSSSATIGIKKYLRERDVKLEKKIVKLMDI